MILNVGCGDDFRGDIRFDINPRKTGLNLIADSHFIPLRDRIFDYVYCKSVLEHLVCPIKGLLEMKRVSRKWIKVIVPNVHRLKRILRNLYNPQHGVSPGTKHLQAWDLGAFKRMVNQIDCLSVYNIGWGFFKGPFHKPSILFGTHMFVILRVEN